MKRIVLILTLVVISVSCKRNVDKDEIRDEILRTEKSFENMTLKKGIAEAFYYYADENAVINRDSLIKGKENIRIYYSRKDLKNATVNWKPDYIYVSECGTLGYTYGRYTWKVRNENGTVTESKGIFHTVWKRQKDNTWKFVWD